MLMYQLLTGSFPFWDSVQNVSLQQVWQAILVKKVDLDSPKLKDNVSDDARDLLKKLLRRDPAKRLTALQALDHPWVKEGGSASDDSLAGSVVRFPSPIFFPSWKRRKGPGRENYLQQYVLPLFWRLYSQI